MCTLWATNDISVLIRHDPRRAGTTVTEPLRELSPFQFAVFKGFLAAAFKITALVHVAHRL